MAPHQEPPELHPRVFFNTNTIVGHLWGWQVDGGDRRVEALSQEILTEAWRLVTEEPPQCTLAAARYHVGAGAEFPDLFYLLDQLRPWLGTAADLITLGAVAKVIIQEVQARLGERGEFVYFSRDILEAICVNAVEERHSGDVQSLSVRSEGFETWFGKGNPVEDPTGEQVYLVWVSANGHMYQFLIDSSGKVWAEYRLNPESGNIERLAPDRSGETKDS